MEFIKINARDCTIKEIETNIEKKFLIENHTQGYVNSIVSYGLYFNDELLFVMSFGKPRFNKNYQWEILRECSKKEFLIRGATSKIWKHFLKNNKVSSCICYSYPHNGVFTGHYTNYCGFRNIERTKKIVKPFYYGKYNGKDYKISVNQLRRSGVDRILGTKFGYDHGTNEEILYSLGFVKKEEEADSPQVDIYYPFSVVYKIVDKTDGKFYIGMCERKENWDNGYHGSGTIWLRHYDKHPDHEYDRIILKSDFSTPKKTRDFELKSLLPYTFLDEHNIRKIDSSTGCLNSDYRTQGDPYITRICSECGGKGGQHKESCSQYKEKKKPDPCPECGRVLAHDKSCSRYKPRRIPVCPECGGRSNNHFGYCSKAKKYICGECGGKNNTHKKGCSKYRVKICPECGSPNGTHKKTCSKQKLYGFKVCEECGGLDGKHRKGCSKYKEKKPCSECGSFGPVHKKTCSKYVDSKPCSECGKKYGHKKGCSKYKQPIPCEECGSIFSHKKTCSQYKDVEPCKECGGKFGHKKTCSKYKQPKPCPECGTIKGHTKDCSRKRIPKPCPECGGIYGHKMGCSKYTPRKYNICPECGNKMFSHKKTCSQYHEIICEECGMTRGHHKKECSKHFSKRNRVTEDNE